MKPAPAGFFLFAAMTFHRYQAFGTHLLASGLVALLSAALVFLLWYPPPLTVATGVTDIFLLLLVVDVVVGPVITLIVFNPAKKELKRDLLVVLLLQLSALLYGLNTVFVARPVYAVYNVDRFDLVYANDLTPQKLEKVSLPQFKSPPLLGLDIIAARRPDDAKERNEIMFDAIEGGDDVPQLPQFYVPYAQAQPLAIKRVQSIETLRGFNPDRGAEIDALVQRHAQRAGGIGFLPLKGKVADLAAIVTLDTAEVVEFVALKPWA